MSKDIEKNKEETKSDSTPFNINDYFEKENKPIQTDTASLAQPENIPAPPKPLIVPDTKDIMQPKTTEIDESKEGEDGTEDEPLFETQDVEKRKRRYQKLINDLTTIIRRERKGSLATLNAKYRIGERILRARKTSTEGKTTNRNGWSGELGNLMKALTKDLGYSVSELRHCLKFAEKYESWDKFTEAFHAKTGGDSSRLESLPKDLTWEYVKDEMLYSKRETQPNPEEPLLKQQGFLDYRSPMLHRILENLCLTDGYVRDRVQKTLDQIRMKDWERATEECGYALLQKLGTKEEKSEYKDCPEDFLQDNLEELGQEADWTLFEKHFKSSKPELRDPNSRVIETIVYPLPPLEFFDEKTVRALVLLAQKRSKEPIEVERDCIYLHLENDLDPAF